MKTLLYMIALVISISSAWVYLDASKHKIGKIPGEQGQSAGLWWLACIGLWVYFFPAYLLKRAQLIERARKCPQESTHRIFKAIVFTVWGSLMIMGPINHSLGPTLPSCDDDDSIELITKIINGQGLQFVSLKSISEQGYNANSGLRACAAKVITTSGDMGIHYSIAWQNKSKDQFGIQLQAD